MLPYNKHLKELSKTLRANQTEAEKCLWTRLKLKHLGYTFYRQKPSGDYIVDFYCPKAQLIIEVDEGAHFGNEGVGNDDLRDKYMRSLGLKVIRFSNSEIMIHTDRIVNNIYRLLNPPSSPFKGGQIVG